MKIIAAVADNLAIGKDNKLLYHLPADIRNFREVTEGKIVIMGRKTFESLPIRPLPNRENWVISTRDIQAKGITLFKHPYDCLNNDDVTLFGNSHDFHYGDKIYVIGGESIYRKFLPFADELIITHVHDTPKDADTFFPEFSEWFEPKSSRHYAKDSEHEFDFDIVTYKPKNLACYQPVVELFRDFLIKNGAKREFEEEFKKQHGGQKLIYDVKVLKTFLKVSTSDLTSSPFIQTWQMLKHSDLLIWSCTKSEHGFWYEFFEAFYQYICRKLLE